MSRCASFPIVVIVLLMFFLADGPGSGLAATDGPGQVSVKAKPAQPALTQSAEGPRILEFSVNPPKVLEGERSTFRWRVEPGASGSPIQTLQILTTSVSGVVYGRVLLEGEYPTPPINTYGRGRVQYTLKIVDQAGRSASRTIEVTAGSLDDLAAGLMRFSAEVATTVDGMRRDHKAALDFENTSGIASGAVRIYAVQAYAPLMLSEDLPDGPVAGVLDLSRLEAGHNSIRMGLGLASTAAERPDHRHLNKLVFLIVKESSPGVIDRILIKALYELIETADSGGLPLYSVRLIKVY
jgi:hypothetical protein